MNALDKNIAASKIQLRFRINNCIKSLEKFNNFDLNLYAKEKSFDQFKMLIIKKDLNEVAKKVCTTFDLYKKGLDVNPRFLLTVFLVKNYPNDIFGVTDITHPIDNNLLVLANNLSDLVKTKEISKIWRALKEFKYTFLEWTKFDKDRTIEQLINSYYNRSQHIEKIKNGSLSTINFEQEQDIMIELERQRSNIIKSIKHFDPNFDIEYLKANYIDIYNNIKKAWAELSVNIHKNMKQAYQDLISNDIKEGNLITAFDLIKNIGERLTILCPKKEKEAFMKKFSDDKLTSILIVPEFTLELNKFVMFMVDFIILMDAPINDENNQLWKTNVKQLMVSSNPFYQSFPKILLQIEEHIDIIFNSIVALKNENDNQN